MADQAKALWAEAIDSKLDRVDTINSIDEASVRKILTTVIIGGYVPPILLDGDVLLAGSHRLTANQLLITDIFGDAKDELQEILDSLPEGTKYDLNNRVEVLDVDADSLAEVFADKGEQVPECVQNLIDAISELDYERIQDLWDESTECRVALGWK